MEDRRFTCIRAGRSKTKIPKLIPYKQSKEKGNHEEDKEGRLHTLKILEKPLVTSEKMYSFENTNERVREANIRIRKALKENQKKQSDSLQYAAQFRAK